MKYQIWCDKKGRLVITQVSYECFLQILVVNNCLIQMTTPGRSHNFTYNNLHEKRCQV